MKNIKVLFFVALFTPWLSKAEASPMKFQETVLVAETQQLSGVDTFSEGSVFSPLTINNNRTNNQGAKFLVAQVKKAFPGVTITNGGLPVSVPNTLTTKSFPDNIGVKKVFASPAVLQKVTSAGEKFVLNTAFTSTQLDEIAVDTNNQLMAGALGETIDELTLTFDGTKTSSNSLEGLNDATYTIIADTDSTKETVKLNIYEVIMELFPN
jgi:hypothetical protein